MAVFKLDLFKLETTEGEKIQIVNSGTYNTDSGPDFSNARIRIGDQLWAGNVEIHIRASDWVKHNHQKDASYKSVVLHVVYENDKDVSFFREDNIAIPTLELKGKFDEKFFWHYQRFISSNEIIPCASQVKSVDNYIRENLLERMLVERLESKAKTIMAILESNKGDWNETFYQWMCRGYGLKINAEPMLLLARNLESRIIAKHKNDLFQLEAFLFGMSGLISGKGSYEEGLEKDFNFLKKKYSLVSLDSSIWKFFRTRPNGFPTLRLAQLAALLHKRENLFSEILGIGDIDALKSILSSQPSNYWKEHYRFGVKSKKALGAPGEKFLEILIINVIVPFLFIYGTIKDESFYKQRALDLLDQLRTETNKVISVYKDLNFNVNSAFHSQGILHLNEHYCKPKKCLNCNIGVHLLK